MKKLMSYLCLGVLFASQAALSGDAEIRKEMQSIAKEQQVAMSAAAKKGSAVDENMNLMITAEQAANLFQDLEITNGIVPGEERVGFVVCTPAKVSMGHIDIARCRIEKRMPQTLKNRLKK